MVDGRHPGIHYAQEFLGQKVNEVLPESAYLEPCF